NGVIDVLRETLLHLRHQLPDALDGLDSIGPRQLVDGNDGAGLSIQTSLQAVVLRAQFDPGHVSDANGPAIRCFAHDDVAELFRRSQAALSQDGIGELLVALSRLAPDLTSRVHSVLGPKRVRYVRDG